MMNVFDIKLGKFKFMNPFVDFITIYQDHEGIYDLPQVSSGCFASYKELDLNSKPEYVVARIKQHKGSFDSHLNIRCDGNRVYMSGNVGAFCRTDNVWGYRIRDIITKCNIILKDFDLPPFTIGEKILKIATESGSRYVITSWSGARVTKLDLTSNFSLGNEFDMHSYINYLSGQKLFRSKVNTYGNYEFVSTVSHGEGSKYVYSKFYIKYLEILANKHKKKHLFSYINGKRVPKKTDYSNYLFDLIEYLKHEGIIRFEVSLKSRFLRQKSLYYLGDIFMDTTRLDSEYMQRLEPAIREVRFDDIQHLKPRLRQVYHAWRAGENLAALYSKSHFYRLRNELLPYGIDIAMAYSEKTKPINVKTVLIQQAIQPDFYHLPKIAA